MKKLTCHCENVELEVNIPEAGFPKLMRCNCSLCKRKGAVMSPLPKENVKLVKGQDSLKLYQYHTKVAEHYFCSNCGIYTHHKMRSNPNMYGIIFCRTRQETTDITVSLRRDGYHVDVLNGDLSQDQRDRVMGQFRKKELQLLVATDVAARGLDVDDISHIINFSIFLSF